MVQPDALLLLSAAVAAVLGALGLGLVRRARGVSAWRAGALAVTASALAWLAAGEPAAGALALASAACSAWPIAVLMGLRSFHARWRWPGRAAHDRALLAALAAALALAWAPSGETSTFDAVLIGAPMLAHLYAAGVIVGAAGAEEGRSGFWIAGAMTIAAVLPTTLVWAGTPVVAVMAALLQLTALAAVAFAFLGLDIVHRREARRLRDGRKRLSALAHLDALTRLPNRRRFETLLERALLREPGVPSVLAIFDLDHFKRINDEFGHAGGDRALRLVARSLRDVLRSHDLPCRHGGDEFVVLLRRARVCDAMRVADRLQLRLGEHAREAQLPALTLSIGMAELTTGEPLERTLQRADLALYEAKRQGRARAVAIGDQHDDAPFVESRPLRLNRA